MVTFLHSATASADGYIAGPEGDMSWLLPFLDEEPDPVIAGASIPPLPTSPATDSTASAGSSVPSGAGARS